MKEGSNYGLPKFDFAFLSKNELKDGSLEFNVFWWIVFLRTVVVHLAFLGNTRYIFLDDLHVSARLTKTYNWIVLRFHYIWDR